LQPPIGLNLRKIFVNIAYDWIQPNEESGLLSEFWCPEAPNFDKFATPHFTTILAVHLRSSPLPFSLLRCAFATIFNTSE
jgi:hypothetical protein